MDNNIRKLFPFLNHKIDNKKIIYFDNAATTQKPISVINKTIEFYEKYNSNVHRSINKLAEKATSEYEKTRDVIKSFINAQYREEIIFTKNATEALNLVVKTFAPTILRDNDIVVLSIAEHHANIVPWLQLQKTIKFQIKYIPLTDDKRIDIQAAEKLLNNPKVKILSITQASNTLGTITPLKRLFQITPPQVFKIIDAAQGIAHILTDVQDLNCDFLAFSGHKIYGPTGTGVLWGRKKLLEKMPTWQGGGDMIAEVFEDRFITAELPHKFEAGTPHIAGIIGLQEAIKFIQEIGFKKIQSIEEKLTEYFLEQLSKYSFIKLYGPSDKYNRLPIFSFTLPNLHPHDIADLLSEYNIMIRAGHHCTDPLHKYLKIPATARISLSLYNTKEEIDYCLKILKQIYQKFL